ncbi:glycosyltransferase family protein [Stappia indica]|uniref:glycosyltransferase family protein n=1 Tax=Stappia indica TaxID=538381 RepID=UPI001CD22FF0|nr:glycosyltransferase [Stappia indica]MCA1300555.1 hypothetical protein [Stappia indica]
MHLGEAIDHLHKTDEMLRRISLEQDPIDSRDQADGRSRKVLIYSSDSFSPGHLRQCRAIANSLVGSFDKLSVLILSGSPIIGRFEFRSRVDFVRVPGVGQVSDGEHMPLSLYLNIDQTVQIRSAIIRNTAEVFEPDIFIVDKEPHGLCGEVLPTLTMLKEADTHIVLGLRDVVNAPPLLQREWNRLNIVPALENLYSEIWIYGSDETCNPVDGLDLPKSVTDKIHYTGFLRRHLPERTETVPKQSPVGSEPYILVKPGGGSGGGLELIEWVLRAYEIRTKQLLPALVILPPFLQGASAARLIERARHLRDVTIIRFTPQIEPYLANAAAIVGMGGYNTFCEVLSFDKPALMVPPATPDAEQALRIERAASRRFVNRLRIDSHLDPTALADALSVLPEAPRPSSVGIKNLLGGLDVIGERVGRMFASTTAAQSVGSSR